LELPEGQAIDTRDMDSWQFPVGTRLWKEFSVEGMRVETRLLQKVGAAEADWSAAAYVWLADGSDAVIAPAGEQNVAGTAHDVPAAAQCFACHGGRASRVLGVSAIQLSHGGSPDEELLDTLEEQGRLSDPPAREFAPPGDETARAALGFLHANCSHCHNQRRPARPGARCFDPEKSFDLSLYTTELSEVVDTAAYRTSVDGVLIPGDPEHSELYRRAESGSVLLRRMPPLATKVPDAEALAALSAWIDQLPLRGLSSH
jgi:cytochrome c553